MHFLLYAAVYWLTMYTEDSTDMDLYKYAFGVVEFFYLPAVAFAKVCKFSENLHSFALINKVHIVQCYTNIG
jgi:hypothetical protein